nr:DnaD domain protein [uncultured Mediterranean phage uvMED]BAR28168.1 DnaD domain protein [uncultured Mediterranean phage uvMED]
MAKKRGYFILYRDIYSNPIFKNLLQASCWIYFISSASHKDVTLRFLDSDVFIKRGEAIMPLRVTAKRFGMTYSEMRSFILRMVRRKMISTRTTQLVPHQNHPSRKVTIINLINYDLYQYVDNDKPPTAQLSQQVSIHKYNTHISNTRSNKDKGVNSGYKSVGEWGQYTILEKDGKKYKKHKWKDEPIKDYE